MILWGMHLSNIQTIALGFQEKRHVAAHPFSRSNSQNQPSRNGTDQGRTAVALPSVYKPQRSVWLLLSMIFFILSSNQGSIPPELVPSHPFWAIEKNTMQYPVIQISKRPLGLSTLYKTGKFLVIEHEFFTWTPEFMKNVRWITRHQLPLICSPYLFVLLFLAPDQSLYQFP